MPADPRSDRSAPLAAAVRRAIGLVQAGELDEATQLLRQTLTQGTDPGVLTLLARVRLLQGDPKEAVDLLARAVKERRKHAPTWVALGRALGACGRWQEAARAFEQASRLDPSDADAFKGLGRSRLMTDQATEAVASIRRAAKLAPQSAEVQDLLGQAYQASGNRPKARAAFRRALELDPHRASAAHRLGDSLRDGGDLERALEHYRKAAELAPDDGDHQRELALTARAVGRRSEAHSAALRAVELSPTDALAHEVLAWTYQLEGELDEAARLYRRAAHLDEGLVQPLYELARTGRLGDLDGIEHALSLEELSADDRATLHYAAAEVLAGRGEDEPAFDRYAQANGIAGAQVEYDPRAARILVRRTVERGSKLLFQRRDGWGDPNQQPVFVLGLARSGVVLVERILGAHPQVLALGEHAAVPGFVGRLRRYTGGVDEFPDGLKDLGRQGALRMARAYLSSFERPEGREVERVVDRAPANVLYLGICRLLFPRARVIHVRRHALDACLASHFAGPAAGAQPHSHDLEHLAQHYEDQERLMEHWKSVLPLRTLELDYEDFIRDPSEGVRRLLSFCGLRWDPVCVDAFDTERAALLSGEPTFTDAPGFWRRFEPHLGALRRLLPPDPEVARAG